MLIDSYLERYLRISSRRWSNLVLNLKESDSRPEFLLGYQRHLRSLTLFKLIKLLRKCTEIDLRCDTNGKDFIRAGLTEIVRRFKCYNSNSLLDVELIRDISYVLKKIKFCQSDTSKVSVCHHEICNNCTNLYGDLLNYSGNKLLFDSVKLLGNKIIKDAYKIKRVKGTKYLNESAVTPYFSIIGSINLELSYSLRHISSLYSKCILQSKSLLNISTFLHVLSKIKCRCGIIRKKLIKQLSYNQLHNLLNNERSDSAKQVSLGQLICSALYQNNNRMASFNQNLLDNITRIIVEKWSFESLCDSLKSQLALYHSYTTICNISVNEDALQILNSVKNNFIKIMPKPIVKSINMDMLNWKTTVFQQQVSNLLEEMGYDIDCEVHIYPYIVDILVNDRIIIEVNGPYHYIYNCDFNAEYNTINNLKLNKNTILKEKLITGCGYKVIHICYSDWPSDKDSQINKLAELLAYVN